MHLLQLQDPVQDWICGLDLFAAGSFSVRCYHILRVQCVFCSSEAIISQASVWNLKDDTRKWRRRTAHDCESKTCGEDPKMWAQPWTLSCEPWTIKQWILNPRQCTTFTTLDSRIQKPLQALRYFLPWESNIPSLSFWRALCKISLPSSSDKSHLRQFPGINLFSSFRLQVWPLQIKIHPLSKEKQHPWDQFLQQGTYQ